MNCIILVESDFNTANKQKVILSGKRFEHIREILKGQKDDSLRVGILNGNMGTGTIVQMSSQEITLNIICDTAAPPPLPLTLICSLQRPKTIKKILQSGTAFGVKRFIFINSWKVEKSYWSNPLFSPDQIKEHCILGLEQCCDTMMPIVEFRKLFKPFVEDELPALTKDKLCLVAHPAAQKPCPIAVKQKPVLLAIGPEGGFIDYEIKMFQDQGFMPVTLGCRILRTEYALATLVGRLFP